MNKNVEKALKEGRLKFSPKYNYEPSKEYQTRFKKESVERESTVIKNSVKKLDNLMYAFKVAEKTGKTVSHVSDGKIILTQQGSLLQIV